MKIVGLLAQQEYTVEQLSAILGLGPSTISHHLMRLARAGLVSARAESYYNYYRLEKGVLEAVAARLLSEETLAEAAKQVIQSEKTVGLDYYAQRVIHNYLLPDGRLKTIPAQRKKLGVVLHHIVQDFEPGVRYSEKTINQMLKRYHADTASLRRELVGFRLMERGKGEYWRVKEELPDHLPSEVKNGQEE